MFEAKISVPATVGRRIRNARKAKGWTLDQLAQALDISRVSVWGWENGKTHPRASRLADVAAALDLPVDQLVDDHLPAQQPVAHPSDLLLECQMRIAEGLGVRPDNVEIKVSFGGAGTGAGAAGSPGGEEFLAKGATLRGWQKRLEAEIARLRKGGHPDDDPAVAELNQQCGALAEQIAQLIDGFRAGDDRANRPVS
jgi:transcriptional regulator with XRE-family HTH domain